MEAHDPPGVHHYSCTCWKQLSAGMPELFLAIFNHTNSALAGQCVLIKQAGHLAAFARPEQFLNELLQRVRLLAIEQSTSAK